MDLGELVLRHRYWRRRNRWVWFIGHGGGQLVLSHLPADQSALGFAGLHCEVLDILDRN
jgi:hypothetical protein